MSYDTEVKRSMRSFASGPLGVLLMVAPLVAIPLLSTLGIPQLFNPVEASPVGGDLADDKVIPFSSLTNEEELVDEDRLEAPEPRRQPSHQSTRKSRNGKSSRARPMISTVLFEPVDDGAPADDGASHEMPDSDALGAIVPLTPVDGEDLSSSDLAPSGSLDGFETVEPERTLPRTKRSPAKHRVLPDEGDADLDLDSSTTELLTKPSDSDELRRPERSSRARSAGAGLRLAQAGEASEGKQTMHKELTIAPLPGAGIATASDSFTLRDAQKRLNDLGIRNFKIESLQDFRFRFTCSITSPDNPQVTRRFVAEAEELTPAVQKALQQVETWLAAR